MKINNAKELFQSKEDYLAFRKAWKDFHNSGKAKPTFTVFEGKTTVWRTGEGYVDIPYTRKDRETVLSAKHYMLYNILRGRNAANGFVAITNEGKLNANKYWPANPRNCGKPNPWQAMHCAASDLIRAIGPLMPGKVISEWEQNRLDAILRPFGNTIPKEALMAIYEPLYAWIQNNFTEVEVKEPETI